MRKHKKLEPFLEQLKHTIGSLKNMKPGEVHVFSINASYGHYQIVIGPKPSADRKENKIEETRPIEISGEIHHLFISPHAVRVHPSRKQMIHNLKDTVIMRDLSIHLCDPKGDGRHLHATDAGGKSVQARECINMAGSKGDEILAKPSQERRLSMAAYKIVQKDILKSLKEKLEESTEVMD